MPQGNIRAETAGLDPACRSPGPSLAGRCFCQFSHVCRKRCERDSNPQSETDHRFSRPAHYQLWHHSKVPLVRVELTMDLSPARVLSPPHIPVLLQRHINTPGEIRTLTEPGLNRVPLPVGIRARKWAGLELHQRCF